MALTTQSTITLRTGNKIPVMGLGTWQLTKDTAGTIARAIELDYRMIDTSGDYGTQPGIGEGVKRSGIERSELFIVTKVEETDDAYQAVQKNLAELDMEYADLILIHRPPTPHAGVELWQGLMKARDEKLAMDIGVSNYATDLIDVLIGETGEVPAINQIEWSPFGFSEDMLDYAKEKQIVIQAYSPLTRAKLLNHEGLRMIALEYNKTPAQILIRWNLQSGTVPIPKANNPDHLAEDIDVFDFEIDEDDMRSLHDLNEHYSALGGLPYV